MWLMQDVVTDVLSENEFPIGLENKEENPQFKATVVTFFSEK